MERSSFLSVLFLTLLSSGGLAWLLYLFADRRLAGSPAFRRLGRRLLERKLAAAERWPLSMAAREGASVRTRFAVVAPLILLKSAVTFVLGPLALMLVPVSVMTVAALKLALEESAELRSSLDLVTCWQASSHLLSAAAGSALASAVFWGGLSLPAAIAANPYTLATALGASALAGLVAAWLEAEELLAEGIPPGQAR